MKTQQDSREEDKMKDFLVPKFSEDSVPPFSFSYNGELSSEFLRNWEFNQETIKIDNKKTEYITTYTDPKTGLAVHCICTAFSDFSALEWVIKFHNTGQYETPIM